MRTLIPFILLAVCIASLSAADWPQWRGADRSNVVADSPPLATTLPKAGPPLLWKSEVIPSKENGGQGSVAIASGKVFAFCAKKYSEAIPTRKLDGNGLKSLGYFANKPPAELLDAVEKARLSEERLAVKPKELGGWVDAWVKANVPEDGRKKWEEFAKDRLSRGKTALPLDLLDKLAEIKDKEFATQAELDAWLDAAPISAEYRKPILAAVPTTRQLAKDLVLCLDAASGATLWKVEFPGRPSQWGSSSTPTVSGGRVYVAGTDRQVYCLNAADGAVVWQAQTKAGRDQSISSSFLLINGVAVLLAGPLTGFSAETGEILWTQPKVSGESPSPVAWASGGKTYLVCNSNQGVACVDPKNGDVLWTVPGGGSATAAIAHTDAGDVMAIFAQDPKIGLVGYRITPEKAEKLWSQPWADRGCSAAIWAGHAYVLGGYHAACVDLASGAVAWDQKIAGEISSPVVADGKVIAVIEDGAGLVMYSAGPEKFAQLAKVKMPIAQSSSPAVVDGRLYLRLRDGVACYDLTPAAPATNP